MITAPKKGKAKEKAEVYEERLVSLEKKISALQEEIKKLQTTKADDVVKENLTVVPGGDQAPDIAIPMDSVTKESIKEASEKDLTEAVIDAEIVPENLKVKDIKTGALNE